MKRFEGAFIFAGTWKATALATNSKPAHEWFPRITFPGNSPINFCQLNLLNLGIPSEFLYRKWLFANASLVQYGVDNALIPRIKSSELTPQQFIDQYDKDGNIVILTDIVSQWNAGKTWDENKLLGSYGDIEFSISHKGTENIKMTMKVQ